MHTQYKSSPKKLAYYRTYIGKPEGAAKHAARMETRRAIRRGELTPQPCEKCSEQKSEVHHKDYLRPLEVTWLCKDCHAAAHHKTHCIHGHELSGDNIKFFKGRRHSCRACHRERARTSRKGVAQ